MASFDIKLPAELWKQVFECLSNCREDLASCRLVCKTFKPLSSEVLFRRVIFARRSDAIRHLLNIVDHTELRTYVKELLYEASNFKRSLATNFKSYEEACHGHPVRVFSDKEELEEIENYAQFSRRFSGYITRESEGIPDDVEKQHRAGTHKGFHNYFRKWMVGNRMAADGTDQAIIAVTLAGLPRLCRITFTDFRVLAQEGEGYPAVCERLFGNTLEPSGPSAYEMGIYVVDLMDVIAEAQRANSESLSFGGQIPESSAHSWLNVRKFHGGYVSDPFHPPVLEYEPAYLFEGAYATEQIWKLRQLRLPVRFHRDYADIGPLNENYIDSVLQRAAPSVVRLSLSDLNLLEGSHEKELDIRGGRIFLGSLLCLTTFPYLQHLELCAWPLPGELFQTFLSQHSSNLKEFCLDECIFLDDPRHLGRWAGNSMSLTGVKMNARVENKDGTDSTALSHEEVSALEALWLAGRPNSLR